MAEGFVIGTDSRAFNKLTERVETDTERKIFAFESSSVSVVFAWAGIVKARVLDADFSLIEISKAILPTVNPEVFGEDLNARLRKSLSVLRANTTGRCASGIFLYLCKGVPMVLEIEVFKNGYTWDSRVSGSGVPNGEIDLVSGGIESKEFGKPTSLDQAKDWIEDYIRDCIADPRNAEIGGEVHIGKLTSGGFDWMVSPQTELP